MRTIILYFFMFFTLSYYSCTTGKVQKVQTTDIDTSFFMPAQFEEQEAVWLGWQGHELYHPVNIAMVKALLPHVKVKLISETDSIMGVAKKELLNAGVNTNSIEFYVMPDNQFWMRDHGAAFIVNRKGEMKAVDFQWSGYGYREWLLTITNDTARINGITRRMAVNKRNKVDSLMGVAENVPIVKSWITIEGGSIEVNGKGTLMLNEPLTLSRNPSASKAEIEQEFKRI